MALENGDAPSAQEKKIIRQVEYYFGDMNLPRDKFLQEKTREDDGWVTMDTMLNFNRLKNICDDKEAICKALLKSTSGLMEVNDDFTKIRRSPAVPLPDNTKERKDDISARSVYVKGFPKDTTLDGLMEFFEKFGKIDSVFMRRDKQKEFKGSVFVIFNSTNDEENFLALEEVKYQETELIKMKKDEYFKMKLEEEKERKKANTSGKDQKKEDKKKEDAEKRVEEQMTKGAVLFVKGLPKDTSLDDVKTHFGQFGDVAWVELATGDDKALVRFDKAEAQAAMEKAQKVQEDGKVLMKESELELRVLEGEEEKDYWRKMFKDMDDRRQNRKNFRTHQNRKRKFGGRNKQGNKEDKDDDETPSKKLKTAEADAE